jgi:hypothetical protein
MEVLAGFRAKWQELKMTVAGFELPYHGKPF